MTAPTIESPQETLTLAVEGMTCEGCAATLRPGLGALEGVRSVEIDLGRGNAVIEGQVGAERVRRRVEELGYRVRDHNHDERQDPGKALERLLAVLLLAVTGAVAFNLAFESYSNSGLVATLSEGFERASLVGVGLGLLFGLLVAFAPATLAIAPAVMGYVTQASGGSGRRAAGLSAAFVSGIVAVDVVVGAVFALGGTAAIAFFSSRLALWYLVAAVVLGALAALNLRLWRPRLPSFTPRVRRVGGPRGAFLLGVPFGLMACPGCTPLLLPVALAAATTGSVWYGAAVMGAFALGRGIPLALFDTFAGAFEGGLKGSRFVRWAETAVGLLLVAGATWFLLQFLRVGGTSAL